MEGGGTARVDGRKPLALIVAIGRDRVIGRSDGELGLPWHISEDLKRFRKLTTGHAIIMGRVTHEAIGRALPKRRNIVLSRQPGYRPAEGAELAQSLDEALERVAEDSLPFVIGGARLYAEAWKRCSVLHVTEVDRAAEGDVQFPAIDWDLFEEVSREAAVSEPDVTFVTWERR